MNREIENILTKIVALHRKDWAHILPKVIWAYKTTWKTTTRFTPFELVYGKNTILPIEFEIKTLRIAMEVGLNITEAQQERITQLHALNKFRLQALQHNELVQNQIKLWNDKFIQNKQFKPGDCALLVDSRFMEFKGKLQNRRLGPYEVKTTFDNGVIKLTTIDDEHFPLMANGHRLKLYHKPPSREEFIKYCQQEAHLAMVELGSTSHN